MSVVVFGATGGTGRAVLRAAQGENRDATAFVRRTNVLPSHPGLRVVVGDICDALAVSCAIAAGDSVVVTLGNSQNPFWRMLGQKRTTAADICETGTRNVIAAMKDVGATRLIVVSAFGIGDTREKASFFVRLFYRVALREQMADKERQEPLVKASGLDWTIVQPVALTDKAPTGRWMASRIGTIREQQIARGDIASFIMEELSNPAFVCATVSLSGVEALPTAEPGATLQWQYRLGLERRENRV